MDERTSRKRLRRVMDGQARHEERIARVPIENMFFKDLPPAFVSVVGPAGSGKSTLVRSMVKYFGHQGVAEVLGPVTLSSSRTRRITLFETRTDIHQFVDVSKVSDLVIFTINAASGLEMETFEFLTLLMSHGLSKVICVVTNTDRGRNAKELKAIKKRIWAEICPGIKLFHVGDVSLGRYTDAALLKLCRTVGVMRYRPVEWKCTHPHVVVDRVDEAFVYGYVRGGTMRKDMDVHVPGVGDDRIADIEVLMDPVPIQGEGKLSGRVKGLYSPMSGIVDSGELPRGESREVAMEMDSDEEIKIFKGGKAIDEVSESSGTETSEAGDGDECPVAEGVESSEESLEFDELKQMTSGRFQKSVETEEELVERFNEKYEEKDKGNFLLREKRRLEAEMRRNEEIVGADVAIPGRYVRIRLCSGVPACVDFKNVIVVGGFLVSEKEMGVVQGKIKRYKWYKKILKTNEAAIFSVGWRRFQSVPVFSMKDATRNRMIKYTPESMHCNVSFYGPVVPAGTGFCVYSESGDFRVLASGTITDVSGDARVVKKLKLVGYPREVVHNTVFVRDMFTSDLEVVKFQGASLRTVSGLRGQVKGPHGKGGEFRATFEGKMLMSDIVTLRCFVPVDVHKVFVPVNNLVGEWRGIRLLWEIREALGLQHSYNQEESSGSGGEEFAAPPESYGLPKKIEDELPLDKRCVPVVSRRIELPVAPDHKEAQEMRESVMRERKKKDEEDDERALSLRRARLQEVQEKKEDRERRVRKTIHDKHREMARGGFKKKR